MRYVAEKKYTKEEYEDLLNAVPEGWELVDVPTRIE